MVRKIDGEEEDGGEEGDGEEDGEDGEEDGGEDVLAKSSLSLWY